MKLDQLALAHASERVLVYEIAGHFLALVQKFGVRIAAVALVAVWVGLEESLVTGKDVLRVNADRLNTGTAFRLTQKWLMRGKTA